MHNNAYITKWFSRFVGYGTDCTLSYYYIVLVQYATGTISCVCTLSGVRLGCCGAVVWMSPGSSVEQAKARIVYGDRIELDFRSAPLSVSVVF